MRFLNPLLPALAPRILWQGADAGGGTGGAADDTTAPAAADDAAASTTAWYDDARFNDDAKGYLTAKGLTAAADPLEAVQKLVGIGQAADRRFGRPLDSVIDKPGKEQSLVDWRKANGEVFGLPAAAEAYEIAKPDGLPEGLAWNADLEGRIRAAAFERGIPPDDMNALADIYATYVTEMNAGIDRDMQQAEEKLVGELRQMWGRDYDAKRTRAAQAASVLAEKAGMDMDGIEAVAGLLSSGDPGSTMAMRLFDAVADMLADDTLIGAKAGVRDSGLSVDEAKAQFQAFTAEGGDWAKASAAADSEAIARLRPQFERLAKNLARAQGLK